MLLLGQINMRCYCCNRNLSDNESTLRSAVSGDFLDTCKKCLADLNIPLLKSGQELDHQPPDDFDDVVTEDFDDEY